MPSVTKNVSMTDTPSDGSAGMESPGHRVGDGGQAGASFPRRRRDEAVTPGAVLAFRWCSGREANAGRADYAALHHGRLHVV